LPQLGRTVAGILETDAPASLTLSDRRFAKVVATPYYRAHPDARICRPDRPAATLLANYKGGYLLYSQFIALANPLTESTSPSPAPAPLRDPTPTPSGDAPGADTQDGLTDHGPGNAQATAAERVRFWTHRECMRLQGFPESFVAGSAEPGASGRFYKQIGNAVCPPIIAAIAEEMLRTLRLGTGVRAPVCHPGGAVRRLLLAATGPQERSWLCAALDQAPIGNRAIYSIV